MFMTTGSRLPEIVYRTSFIRTRPWPEVKLVTRPPATANPSHTAAAECSLSGSKNMRGSPHRFLMPFMTAPLNPPPIVVELVIGYAPAAWLMAVSTWTTASAPSQVVGIPGYWYEVSAGSLAGSAVRTGPFATATLMRSFPSAERGGQRTSVGSGPPGETRRWRERSGAARGPPRVSEHERQVARVV